jgi:hypothetical protein
VRSEQTRLCLISVFNTRQDLLYEFRFVWSEQTRLSVLSVSSAPCRTCCTSSGLCDQSKLDFQSYQCLQHQAGPAVRAQVCVIIGN